MNTQPELFQSNQNVSSQSDKPVVCLGIEFESDTARRDYFTELLREKLNDHAFRSTGGFPLGSDKDILNLSDPPYYTACPNPWISDFISEWENKKPEQSEGSEYHREPFAADVSEGRSGLFYDAHSYHTKVPHKAIMRYILHYTSPGDIVLDSFCGTGMAGVAAQLCGDKETVESLGYKVSDDGIVSQEIVNSDRSLSWQPFSKLGARHAILNDLSSAATFIGYNLNSPVDVDELEAVAIDLLRRVDKEVGWVYETNHYSGKGKGKINYIIWSDVFSCANCTSEIIFWDSAVDHSSNKMKSEISCPSCGTAYSKSELDRLWVSELDGDEVVKKAKQVPVLINYMFEGKRYEKTPDKADFDLIEKIKSLDDIDLHGSKQIPEGYNTKQPKMSHGVNKVRDFYTSRNLYVLTTLRKQLPNTRVGKAIEFLINSYDLTHSTLMSRVIFKGGGKKPVLTGYQSGTLYISSLPVEKNIIQGILKQKLPIILKSLRHILNAQIVSTGSASDMLIDDESVDYLFIDPPFGANIMYSELNFLSESWSGVLTNDKLEAIENRVQKKSLSDYRMLMELCFKEAYRVLKKGHWMTVEFSNTKAAVWNSIQSALNDAGFIIANVSALDKKQGSFKAVTTPTAVKQDLVISAYKPDSEFENIFVNNKDNNNVYEMVWNFIRDHLHHLPVVKKEGLQLIAIPERDARILYDQLITYYVRHGYNIPIDSKEFQSGLLHNFIERDGMYFLPEQVSEYDSAKMAAGNNPIQLPLFISDEASAIEWLRQLLRHKPQTFQDINPEFMQEISGWSKSEISLELSTLLEQNFLQYDGNDKIPTQILSTLSDDLASEGLDKADYKGLWYIPDPSKAQDLEKLRDKALIKEFDLYAKSNKKLKEIRLEAVRSGFKKAWQNRDYKLIKKVAEKIPNKVLEEDPKLLMWYDQAMTRLEF